MEPARHAPGRRSAAIRRRPYRLGRGWRSTARHGAFNAGCFAELAGNPPGHRSSSAPQSPYARARREEGRERPVRAVKRQDIRVVIAAAATTSSTVAPRDRSHSGRAKPCRKGPTARIARGARTACSRCCRRRGRGTRGRWPDPRRRSDASSSTPLPWERWPRLPGDRRRGELRSPCARDLHRPPDLLDPLVLRAAVRREREHRHRSGASEQPLGVPG